MLREMEDVMNFERKNKMARKMTPSQVADMRLAYSQGATQGQLCARFGVSVGTVGRIVRGESWIETAASAQRMPSPREFEDSQQRLLATQAAMREAPELKGLAEEFEEVLKGYGPSAPTRRIPNPLEGDDVGSEVAGEGLTALQRQAAAMGVDIDKLRGKV